jgi:hypothetical protein
VAGLSHSTIRTHIDAGRWQVLHRGVFATFTGPVPRLARMRAAVLVAGAGATLSHQSAGELWRLVDGPAPVIHVTIPADRRVAPRTGLVIHLSPRIDAARHPTRRPPVTRIDETVLDIVSTASSRDDALATMSAAVGRRLTTAARLATALAGRPRFRWRAEIRSALLDIAAGAQSILELRYARDVERAHGLPSGERQSRAVDGGRTVYRDVRYPGYRTVVELDGSAAHPVDRRLVDGVRDNIAAIAGDVVLHYGWDRVTMTPCLTAAEVAGVLHTNGWPGQPRPCGPDCVIAKT